LPGALAVFSCRIFRTPHHSAHLPWTVDWQQARPPS